MAASFSESVLMNHCLLARSTTGCLVRQSYTLAEDAEPRQPRPRSRSVAPVIRHHALTLVLLGSLELISEVISDDDPHLDVAAILTQYRGPHLPGRDQRSGAG